MLANILVIFTLLLSSACSSEQDASFRSTRARIYDVDRDGNSVGNDGDGSADGVGIATTVILMNTFLTIASTMLEAVQSV